MKDLGRWQLISFVSRISATLIGILPSLLIIDMLTTREWGVVQLAVSLGGALGIYQHLGLASASTREISNAKSDTEVFKIFITSSVIRYLVNIPLAVGLFLYADTMAIKHYHNVELALPLKLYAIALVFQGAQSLLNSVISGTMRFKSMFIYQVAIAFVNAVLTLVCVYFYKVNGYFYAFLAFNIISTLTLGILAFKPLKISFELPSKQDFMALFREMFSITMAIYLVKIIYTNWEKLGNNMMGTYLAPEVLAIFSFALLFSKKIMNISDSVTDVSLPMFSEKFLSNIEEFKELFSKNFNQLFSLILIAGAGLGYWAYEISLVVPGAEKTAEYLGSFILIMPLMLSFVMYSFMNIVKSSVLIPAKLVPEMIISYILLLGVTVVSFFIGKPYFDPLKLMSWSMAIGSTIAFVYMLLIAGIRLKVSFFNIDHVAILVQFAFILYASLVTNIWIKGVFFVIHMALLVWACLICKFITTEDLLVYVNKARTKLNFRKSSSA